MNRTQHIRGVRLNLAESLPDRDTLDHYHAQGINTLRLILPEQLSSDVSSIREAMKRCLMDHFQIILVIPSYDSSIVGCIVSMFSRLARHFPSQLSFELSVQNKLTDGVTLLKEINESILAIRVQGLKNQLYIQTCHRSKIEYWFRGFQKNNDASNATIFTPDNIADPLHRTALSVRFPRIPEGESTQSDTQKRAAREAFLTWIKKQKLRVLVIETGPSEQTYVESHLARANQGGLIGWSTENVLPFWTQLHAGSPSIQAWLKS